MYDSPLYFRELLPEPYFLSLHARRGKKGRPRQIVSQRYDAQGNVVGDTGVCRLLGWVTVETFQRVFGPYLRTSYVRYVARERIKGNPKKHLQIRPVSDVLPKGRMSLDSLRTGLERLDPTHQVIVHVWINPGENEDKWANVVVHLNGSDSQKKKYGLNEAPELALMGTERKGGFFLQGPWLPQE